MGIAEGGYEMGNAEDIGFLCVPSTTDSRELKCFKSRACSCHESLNSRLTKFGILQQTFHHGMKCHEIALRLWLYPSISDG